MGGLYEGVQCGFQRPRERKEREQQKKEWEGDTFQNSSTLTPTDQAFCEVTYVNRQGPTIQPVNQLDDCLTLTVYKKYI